MKTKIILLLAISALFAGCVQEEADEKFTVVEILNESCTADSQCITPEGYLARSVCPYTSKCIDNQCTVICPEGWMVGGERDEHGCLGPAGYAWDEDIGACTREWELDEGQRRAAKIAVAPLSYPVTVTGVNVLRCPGCFNVGVDVLRCPGCFNVHLQRNDNQEQLTVNIRNWGVSGPVACPEDAKICSDGTVVGRVAPDCEFAPCPSQEMNEELCSSAGGNWNECSSRCQLENQGRSDVACTMMCESLCECAGFAGFACPEGYTCRTPSRIADALGYCVKAEGPISGASVVEANNDIVDANNEFALDLYRELMDSGGNMFYSPWSILSALAMTYEGARGQTAEEMREVLHLPEDDEARRNSFRDVQEGINKEDKSYELLTANALWPQQDYPFLDGYIDTIRTYYGGEATALDYVTETEKSRQTINSWVEEKTNDKIKDLIPAGVLGPLTRMVLTNAIYFKGTWVMQFDEEDTREEDFHVSPEETVTAQMMSLTGDDARFNYAEDEDVQVLELPYDGEEV
ncbi:MAG: serpin family protein, partial [Candidatus Altiarchaeota archaeon]|nr:serpin family protein [Candidatus Altiarchaeota archaeon]